MNPNDRGGAGEGDAREDDAKREFANFLASVAAIKAEQDAFGAHAPAAMERLARVCYGHDNSQAQTVAACIASIYNGQHARPVRLDEVRWLDWKLQRDLIVVLVGTGHGGFEDRDIRKAFFAVGGDAAVEWLHWYTTGGPHRAALKRLVAFVKNDAFCSSAGIVRNALRSLYNGTTVLSVAKLTHLGSELSGDMALVLDGIIERDSGVITEDVILSAFKTAGLVDALTEEVWPRGAR